MTLQEQYNLIKSNTGGNKSVFLKEAKSLFPEWILNKSTFDETVQILKNKNIIWETKVNEKLISDDFNEMFKKNILESEDIKSNLNNPSKYIDGIKSKNYYFNEDNINSIDSLYGQQFINGVLSEISDNKNSGKTREEIFEIVAKNLTKDKQYYLKNYAFGVKGLGYTDDSPGLKLAKTDKMVPVPKEKNAKLNEVLNSKRHKTIKDEFNNIANSHKVSMLNEKINILNNSIKESYRKYKNINESSSTVGDYLDSKKLKELKLSIKEMIDERNLLKSQLLKYNN